MKDCNGKSIRLNSTLKCVNDVNYGKIYRVVKFGDGCSLLGIYIGESFSPLSGFATNEIGCLIDFERIEKG